MYQPDLSIPHQPLASQQRDVQQEQQQQTFDLNTALATEKLVQEHYNTMDMRDKSRLRSVSIAAAQVKPFLDAGDTQGALNFALNRQKQLHARMGTGENIDDEDTQAFIDYLQKGDLQTAKGMVDSTISLGFMTGALKPSENGTSAMERAISNLMAENPGLTYSGALYQYQIGNRQGTQLDASGNVVPLPNSIDTSAQKKSSDKLAEEMGGGAGKGLIELKNKATDATMSLESIGQARSLLDSGIKSGTWADARLGFGKALATMGFSDAEDPVANTEAFIASQGAEVGNNIKQFGSGTGLSDADREYAAKIVGGQITLNEKSIRKILDIREKQSKWIINRFNLEYGKAPKSASPYDLSVPTPAEQTTTNQPTAGSTIDWNSF